ncbi:PTS mannose/fructose/sorbose/N-acetylgalactosamine transporter subunit IIC [Pectinatus cerevisiiphilus]|uniref:PTS system mannose-specific IIC component n=1 Tax=Pectinatus cerevisiiphilus TaxID=86956 RepID=A0A4R3K5R4_9FIRM|nr:PTS sugar transporter subunit IIC [Pectinatus cerevisiiphilus]TCS78178.1 PTS system mannose-specific IIC component [Pectinatus cerevisiiphilus]
MEINIFQAVLLGICACLSSMPGLGGTTFGNYTLGRPLVAGLIVGLILGDVKTGIIIGAAIQVIYIALVTPGGTVSADVRAISYIGIPLAICAVKGMGLDPDTAQAQSMAAALGAAVGTLGTVLFYGTATMNLIWQHIGWKAVENGDFKKLYLVDMGLPWISHFVCSFLPTVLITLAGAGMVDIMKAYLPMDGIAMKTLFTVGSLLPAVGVAILLKQVVKKTVDFITFFFGFTLAASLGLNLIAAAIIGSFFAVINYKIIMLQNKKAAAGGPTDDDDDEEDI